MEKKISKTLKRIQDENPEIDFSKSAFKKLSPSEIKILKNLKEKYDLSFFSINNDQKRPTTREINLSDDLKKTLERINEGREFKI